MRAIVQRVSWSSVTVNNVIRAEIGVGLNVLLGITQQDVSAEAKRLVEKILNLRIFPASDGDSGFDKSVTEIGGELLLVSQFTLYGDIRKGRRPGFTAAANGALAQPIFDEVVTLFRASGLKVEQGVFGAMMDVKIHNAGPATFIIDTDVLKAAR